MSHALSALMTRTARAVAPPTGTDGQLLGRFALTRDEAAFAELVRRLGPLVLGACRRIAPDAHTADDSFQATFLVLARRAADVQPAEAVRGWLHGVAVRCAKEARAVNARRRAREVPVPAVPDRPTEPAERPDADALRALDEEVAQLPEHLRAAVVLCELDGLSRKEAAGRLGLPEGTLSSRLAKARKLLADRLRQRGLVLPVGGLTVLVHAAVSPRLLARTSALASTGAAVPPAVAGLTSGVFRTMFLQRLTVAGLAAVLLAACALAATSGAPNHADPPKPPASTPAPEKKAPAPKPPGPGTLVVGRTGAYWVLTPEGKKLPEHPLPEKVLSNGHPALSPDGKTVALVFYEERPPERARDPEFPWQFKIAVRPIGETNKEKAWDLLDVSAHGLAVHWTADGKKLVVVKELRTDKEPKTDPVTFENVLLDPSTGKTEPLDLPEGARVLDCGKNGKTFVVEWRDPKTKKKHLALAAVGDEEVRTLTALSGYAGSFSARLSPDGSTILFTDGDPERKDAYVWGVSQRPYLLNVRMKKREALPDFPENGQATGIAWSPDGKRIAYAWKQLHADVLKKNTISGNDATVETEAFLIVADADGKNPKTVATDKGRFAINMIFGSIDWR